jgi:hypothetical protein
MTRAEGIASARAERAATEAKTAAAAEAAAALSLSLKRQIHQTVTRGGSVVASRSC